MTKVAYHMVHYREFDHNDSAHSAKGLDLLLRERLSSVGPTGAPRWNSIGDRLFDIGDGTGLEIILNRVADLSSAVFGEMCLINTNGVQALLEMTAATAQLSTLTLAEVYSLTEAGAPAGTRYIRGLAYFLAIGNHLFFIRTQSFTPAYIQQYLSWLLKLPSNGLAPECAVHFESKFDKSVVGNNIGEVKALRVSGPNFPQMSIQPVNDIETKERSVTKKIADKFVEFGQAFELTSVLLGPAKAKSLAESLGPKERLVVDASVKIRGSRTEQSKTRMKQLASELDEITEGKITIEGKDGKIDDKDVMLRTSMPFDTGAVNSTLLDFDNVADQLQIVYKRFVEDKKIKA